MDTDQERPNILWIVAEDLGQEFFCYGNPDVVTPNVDSLAAQGRLYHNAFATSPVCSPSRSALITGLYQTSIGAHHHRSHRHDGYRLPEGVKLVPQRLRQAGYFCAQITDFPRHSGLRASGKVDWNFTAPEHVWDSDSWADLKAHQPFFAMINLGEAHRPYRSKAGPGVDPDQITTLPPYVADHPLAREDWAAYLETIQSLDMKIGAIMALIDEDGLRDNTLVAFFGDHGREDFRGKASAFDGGYRVPLVIRWPDHLPPGSASNELVSLIDISASTLALAGLPTAEVHGLPFLVGEAPPREFVFMARDRIEESLDRVRMVFDGRFRYIRNFLPDQAHFIERDYYDRTNPVRSLMRELHAEGKLTPEQAKVFALQRPPEELYDLQSDPYELHNLVTGSSAALPDEAQSALFRMRAALESWIEETGDQGGEPEDPEAVDVGGGPGGKKKGKSAKNKQSVRSGKRGAGARTAAAVVGAAQSVGPLVLSRVGVMFAGGREVSSPGRGGRRGGGLQTNIIEQAPVHFLIPYERRQTTPVVMLPGHGLTSYIYLSTPDGREGWAQTFARHGYAVYVMDQPNYAISGFDLRPFEALRSGQAEPSDLPGLVIWSNESAWRDWGIGPEPGVPFEDTQFPFEKIDQLFASYTAVIGGGKSGRGEAGNAGSPMPAAQKRQVARSSGGKAAAGDRFGAAVKTRALVALLEQIGPSILLVHSAAGAVGVEILRRRPELVSAVVMIEPVGSPTDPIAVKSLFAGKPYVAVFGDHFEVRKMQGRYEACLETARIIKESGGLAEMIYLPELGVRGNTHLLMQDANNREIAERVIAWFNG
ncbi:MAG: sulfatase-like hydrolase/transferase [Candidatus Promineifilaceae bacterium]